MPTEVLDVALQVNGKATSVSTSPDERLLDVLRESLQLAGTKEGCGEGECGACTVLLDDDPVLSCLVPVGQCAGRRVETVEWVAERDPELLERMTVSGGIQCGACTPGIVVTLYALRQRVADPSREQIREALAGNLCRCTGYEGIFRALEDPGGD